jgi:hypothetical protein
MVHMLQGMVARLIRGSKDALALLREVSAQGETRPLVPRDGAKSPS